MIKNIIMVIGGLWILKHLHAAHVRANLTSELHPVDPYASVSTQWDILNGYGMGEDGTGPQAHKPFYVGAIGQEPATQNPCVC